MQGKHRTHQALERARGAPSQLDMWKGTAGGKRTVHVTQPVWLCAHAHTRPHVRTQVQEGMVMVSQPPDPDPA